MIQFGVRAHDFCPPADIETFAERMKGMGICHIQLALEKSITGYDFSCGHYSAGFAGYLGRELAKRDLHVAVLGCYINPVNPDENLRLRDVERFKERLRYAKHMNADMVGTETGRYSRDMSVVPGTDSKECYRILLDSFERIVTEAEALGVVVGVEGVFDHTLSSPEKMRQFLKDLASPAVEVILDTANLMSPDTAHNPGLQNETIQKAFDFYGGRISVLHLKDCVFDAKGVQVCTRPGEGLACYDGLMKQVRRQKPHIIGLLEESSPKHYERDREFFVKQWERGAI
ncbi:MAG: TIM barrel protein [Lachnospiraceae bacterium]|nr:TIM barrel protein [Lachnospiraceae bacterium]